MMIQIWKTFGLFGLYKERGSLRFKYECHLTMLKNDHLNHPQVNVTSLNTVRQSQKAVSAYL